MVRLGRAHAAGTTATRRETMSKPPRRAKPPNWSRKLARVIMLDDGRIGSCTYVAHRNGPRATARRS